MPKGSKSRDSRRRSGNPPSPLPPASSTAASSNHVTSPNLRTTRPEDMADPFEVRMRFTSQLQHLNASVTSAQKAAHYALKYRDMDEDLHSCILEQLERNNMNNRANIMYFMEHLCDLAAREEHPEFIRMMERDILKIIDLVAPDDGSGAANVKVVRKVLAGLQSKSFLQAQTIVELEDCIKDRDVATAHPALSSPVVTAPPLSGGGGGGGGDNSDGNAGDGLAEPVNGSISTKDAAASRTTPLGKSNGNVRLDKRQIEQRIEEDRERHKRLRENIWAVGPGEDEENNKMWEETDGVDEDDSLAVREDAEERNKCEEFDD
ncbi:hypothetical protein LTR50_005027 [Elasticomyces elasticus]|nr:hypothetical protein LTR50_005027 [Elasticomyces elasticus]